MTSPASGAGSATDLPGYAPVPPSALGPALNDQRYYVGRVQRNLYWVTDGVHQSAFLENAWAGGKAHLDTVTERAAAPVVAKYTGVLAAADIEIFTYTTTFQIMQSLRLDSGTGVDR